MSAILTTAGIRALEARHALAVPPLMERAGTALASEAAAMLADGRRPVLVLAGPGNNGGDGLVAARLLKQRGLDPQVVLVADPERLPADAHAALRAWLACGGTVADSVAGLDYGLAIDALFGIGLTRPVEGRLAERIAALNALPCPVLAVDIPSGLCADTGRVLGAAVRATRTLTFIALKPGLLTREGPDHCGGIAVCNLDIAIDAPPPGRLVSPALFADRLQPRRRDSHKGSFGSVAVIGGAPGMAGAALLAGRAALKLGAGRVYVGTLAALPADPLQPELMLRPPPEAMAAASVLALGPGLGHSTEALDLLRRAIATDLPLVLDADALNLLAAHPVLIDAVARRNAAAVLTPHPAEAGRLLGIATDTVQDDRLAAALALARKTRAQVVLKGCGSILAKPGGGWMMNASGNPGLASAGSGDVLTGMIAALLAQGWPAGDALAAAVHLHGAAADALVHQGDGPVGLTAGELIDTSRRLLNHWIDDA